MIFYMIVQERPTTPREPSPARAPRADRRSRLRAGWDAAVPTLVAVGLGLLAFLGAAYSGARPS